MVDDRARIVSIQHTARLSLHLGRHTPRLVQVALWHARQLGQPAPDVDALWIVFLALQHGVKDPEIRRGVGAGARRPLPAAIVGRRVAVEQMLHEPAPRPSASRSADPCTRNEATIMRARLCIQPLWHQLAHGRVDDRIAGAPCAPRGEFVRLVAPADGAQVLAVALLQHRGHVVQDLLVELAPDQLVEPGSAPSRAFSSGAARCASSAATTAWRAESIPKRR